MKDIAGPPVILNDMELQTGLPFAFADLPAEQARDLLTLPTRLSLEADQVERTVQAGRDVIAKLLP